MEIVRTEKWFEKPVWVMKTSNDCTNIDSIGIKDSLSFQSVEDKFPVGEWFSFEHVRGGTYESDNRTLGTQYVIAFGFQANLLTISNSVLFKPEFIRFHFTAKGGITVSATSWGDDNSKIWAGRFGGQVNLVFDLELPLSFIDKKYSISVGYEQATRGNFGGRESGLTLPRFRIGLKIMRPDF